MHTSLEPRLPVPDFVSQLCETKSTMESLGSRLDAYHKWLALRFIGIVQIKNITACNHYAQLAIYTVIQLVGIVTQLLHIVK